jgi:glycosyltransferase involved in cell wall biosynthesis
MIPAHDEASLLGEALESLAAQTRNADEVIVIADRCTDRTSQVAVAHGASPHRRSRRPASRAGQASPARRGARSHCAAVLVELRLGESN